MQHKHYFIVSILLIIIDQLSKIWISNNLVLYEIIEINKFINITYLHNKGAAFSMLADFEFSRYLLPLISIIACIAIVIFMLKTNSKNIIRMLALTLILAGAFGNFIDRFLEGFVIDFISLHYEQYYFAVFNIADMLISIAVLLFIFSKND